MTYRDDLEAAQARIEALQSELAEALRERDEARRERDQARKGPTVAAPVARPKPAAVPSPAPPPPAPPPPPNPVQVRAARERLHVEETEHWNHATVATRFKLARTLIEVGEWERAHKLLEGALELNFPGSGHSRGDVYLLLGQIEVALCKSADALAYYQRGLRHEPDHPGLNQALAALARA